MYQMLVVDDEPVIADGLFRMFSENSPDELKVYKSYSGPEAITHAEKTRIDILLTDICMPGMDGLALYRNIAKLWPVCRAIFLTGYDDFEYIRSALRCQCTDYILKYEGRNPIRQAVKQAENELSVLRSNERLLKEARASIRAASSAHLSGIIKNNLTEKNFNPNLAGALNDKTFEKPDHICNISDDNISTYLKSTAETVLETKSSESIPGTKQLYAFIQNYIEEHIDGNLSLTHFSEMLHYHPFYLSRLFKQISGQSLSEYIWSVKITKARQMLGSSLQINEIATKLGFETASYFTRFFKKYEGVTPQQFRNSLSYCSPE